MERDTILNAINNLMLDYGKEKGYNLNPATEITSNQGCHQVYYEVRLSGGTFIIYLSYNKGVFEHSYDTEYPKGKNTTDFKEQYDIGIHFDGKINVPKMTELFGLL